MPEFIILVLEGALASSVAISQDVLAAAATLAGRAGLVAPHWRLCSPGGGSVSLAGGATLATERLPTQRSRATWIVPGLNHPTRDALASRLLREDARAAVRAIARHVAAGGTVAASCSGVFLLQGAGLLDGRRATTTWWLAPYLQELAPRCRVDADRMICVDGPVTSAGAALAHTDLMLHMVRKHCGVRLAGLVTQYMLIETRPYQAPFIVPTGLAGGSALVDQLTSRVERMLPATPSIPELARRFGMSERTLGRHVRRATGKGTLALIQAVRLRRARQLLQTSRLSIERIAAAVGYQDATALRRTMRRLHGVTPSSCRPAR